MTPRFSVAERAATEVTTMGRMKTVTVESILDKAVPLFRRHGYFGVSIKFGCRSQGNQPQQRVRLLRRQERVVSGNAAPLAPVAGRTEATRSTFLPERAALTS